MVRNTNLYLSLQLDTTHLIWIKSNGFFVLLENPAFRVFEGVIQGFDNERISILLEKEFKLREGVAQFVDEMKELSNSYLFASSKSDYSYIAKNLPPSQIKYISTYQFGENKVSIAVNSDRLLSYFHPLIEHLQIPISSIPIATINLSINNDILSLQNVEGEWRSWDIENNAYFKGALFTEILNCIYKKKEEDWMMTLHASGISNGEKAILFSAAAGKGKSTIASFLHANGYPLLSDDFIPLDLDGHAYQFPIAMTVKQGAVELLSDFYKDLPLLPEVVGANSKMVRYLPYEVRDWSQTCFPIKAVVFVEYSNEKPYLCEELSLEEALPLLLTEVFVTPKQNHVKAFMQWVGNVQFYRLAYSDSSILTNLISEIYHS